MSVARHLPLQPYLPGMRRSLRVSEEEDEGNPKSCIRACAELRAALRPAAPAPAYGDPVKDAPFALTKRTHTHTHSDWYRKQDVKAFFEASIVCFWHGELDTSAPECADPLCIGAGRTSEGAAAAERVEPT